MTTKSAKFSSSLLRKWISEFDDGIYTTDRKVIYCQPCSQQNVTLHPTLTFDATSVDVERSFSTYKEVLTEKRTNFTPEHLEKYMTCNLNSETKLSE